MSSYNWNCPYCNHNCVIGSDSEQVDKNVMDINNPMGPVRLTTHFVVCSNEACRKFTLDTTLRQMGRQTSSHGTKYFESDTGVTKTWRLMPPSMAKPFPSFIPQPILEDYTEACLIKELSPKASATLSRRCLQGILRDFWKVTPGNLAGEIKQIKKKVDPIIWDAIDSVRKVGNIGAHMEADINLIVEVDPNEAQALIGLIEMLLDEWYISREERIKKLEGVKAIAVAKEDAKKPGKEELHEEEAEGSSSSEASESGSEK